MKYHIGKLFLLVGILLVGFSSYTYAFTKRTSAETNLKTKRYTDSLQAQELNQKHDSNIENAITGYNHPFTVRSETRTIPSSNKTKDSDFLDINRLENIPDTYLLMTFTPRERTQYVETLNFASVVASDYNELCKAPGEWFYDLNSGLGNGGKIFLNICITKKRSIRFTLYSPEYQNFRNKIETDRNFMNFVGNHGQFKLIPTSLGGDECSNSDSELEDNGHMGTFEVGGCNYTCEYDAYGWSATEFGANNASDSRATGHQACKEDQLGGNMSDTTQQNCEAFLTALEECRNGGHDEHYCEEQIVIAAATNSEFLGAKAETCFLTRNWAKQDAAMFCKEAEQEQCGTSSDKTIL